MPSHKTEFYPDPIFIVTKFPLEISWVIFELKGIFNNMLDYQNKEAFYAIIAQKIIKCSNDSTKSSKGILKDVIQELVQDLDEIIEIIN